MGLRARLSEAMKAAMRAKETRRLSTVRLMLDAVQKQDIATKTDISDDEVLTVLARMIKQREESAATYESGGRPELAAAEREPGRFVAEGELFTMSGVWDVSIRLTGPAGEETLTAKALISG